MRNSLIFGSALVFLSFGESIKGNHDWDVLIFTQNWLPSVCQQFKDEGENHACTKLKSPDAWTVHGVWPTKLGTLGPGFCDPNNKFDPSQIVSLVDELNNAWPSIDGVKGSTPFWTHEWEKHGTCAMQLPQLSDEVKYFRQGLDWLHQYNMTDILGVNGITPSDEAEYPAARFQQAVFQSLGVNPRIECEFHKHTRKPFLLEIRICFDKGLNLIDCDGTMLSDKTLLTNCPTVGNIHYGLHMPPDSSPTPSRPRRDPKRMEFVRMLRTVMETLVFLDWII